MHCTEKVRRRLASWLCILFIGYTAATSFFYHAHYVNGRWIVHSHPYTQAPEIEAICIALVSQEFLHLSLRGPPAMCL